MVTKPEAAELPKPPLFSSLFCLPARPWQHNQQPGYTQLSVQRPRAQWHQKSPGLFLENFLLLTFLTSNCLVRSPRYHAVLVRELQRELHPSGAGKLRQGPSC